jgi:hypothetical protein
MNWLDPEKVKNWLDTSHQSGCDHCGYVLVSVDQEQPPIIINYGLCAQRSFAMKQFIGSLASEADDVGSPYWHVEVIEKYHRIARILLAAMDGVDYAPGA